MEKQESESKWDDLARELGAEIPPEIVQREEAVAMASQETASAPAQRPRETIETPHAPLPKRSATDWNSLASDLGLPPTEPEAPPVAETPPQESRPEPPQREMQAEPRRRENTQSRRPERSDRERRPRREESERHREHREPRRDRGEKRREQRRFEEEAEREPEFRSAPREEAPTEPPEKPQEQPQKPAVSLWHKIFGTPAEPTTRTSDEPPQADVVAPSDFRDVPRSEGSDFDDAHPDDSLRTREDEDRMKEHGEAPAEGEDADQSDQRRGRPRRRRGRGRGRGRKPEDDRTEGRSSEHRHHERTPATARREAVDEIADDDVMDDADSDDAFENGELAADDGNGAPTGASTPGRTSVLARAIPSWDEAIGFIVDTNMQSRSQRRPPSRSGSRDNSSRGRSRGRRKS